MKTLISELKNEGLTEEQIEKTFHILIEWMDDAYPVAAALTRGWLKDNWDDLKMLKRYS